MLEALFGMIRLMAMESLRPLRAMPTMANGRITWSTESVPKSYTMARSMRARTNMGRSMELVSLNTQMAPNTLVNALKTAYKVRVRIFGPTEISMMASGTRTGRISMVLLLGLMAKHTSVSMKTTASTVTAPSPGLMEPSTSECGQRVSNKVRAN